MVNSGSSRSGGAASQLTATFMSKLLESGDLQQHIVGTLQPAYARRYYSLMSAVKEHLSPLGVKLPQTERDLMGGYFVWFLLPSPLDAVRLAIRAKTQHNLIVAPGAMFAVYGDPDMEMLKGKIRVCFAWEQEELIVEGIERLSRVIRNMQEELDRGEAEESPTPVVWSDSFFR